ncbi:MAG: linear amide C-N hydrolase [Paludibacteraceae bacterium]|nr:linear amide C-N hydrolase [Paludibacteraceae bacterium]
MKKVFLALMAVAAIALTGCKADNAHEPKPTPVKPSDVTWTDDQWKTIQSIRKVDDMGYLYEMNCLFDYKTEEVLAANSDNLIDLIRAIKSVILKESKTDFVDILKSNLDVVYSRLGGCTCFSMAGANGGNVLGRNYDFPPFDDHTLIVHTPQVKDESGKITRYATVGTCDLGILTQFMNEEHGYQTPRMQELALYAPYFILDGMNDQGLMSGLMVLEYDGTYQDNDKARLTNAMITRVILDKCATVNEAIDMLKQFDIISVFQTTWTTYFTIPWVDMHFAFADKNGDRAIVEWTENTMRVLRGNELKTQCRKQTNPRSPEIKPQTRDDYVIATNYYLSKDAMEFPDGYTLGDEMGFWRHDTVDSLLNLTNSLTSQKAMDVCQAVRIMKNDPDCWAKLRESMKEKPLLDVDNKQDWPWITIWSSVYDNSNMSVLFCSREEFNRRYEFGLQYK